MPVIPPPEHVALCLPDTPVRLQFATDGLLASGLVDGTVATVDATNQRLRAIFRVTSEKPYCRIEAISATRSGSLLAGAAENGRIAVFDLDSGAPVFEHDPGDTLPTTGLAFSRDGQFLAVRRGKDLRLLETQRWGQVWRIGVLAGQGLAVGAGQSFWSDECGVTNRRVNNVDLQGAVQLQWPTAAEILAHSDDGRFLVLGGIDKSEMMCAETGQSVGQFPAARCAAISNTGVWAIGTWQRTILFGRLEAPGEASEFPLVDPDTSRPFPGYALAFDSTGRLAWGAGRHVCLSRGPLPQVGRGVRSIGKVRRYTTV